MSIAAPTRPEVVVHGIVLRSRELKKKDTGEVFGYSYLVDSPSGALYITGWLSGDAELPNVGDTITAWCAVQDDQRGSQLSYQRAVSEADLDALAATFRVLT